MLPDPGGLANRHRRAARGTIERRSGYSPDNTGNNHENCNPFIGNGACARQHGGTRASPGIGRLRNRYRSFRRLIHRSGRYDQRAAHLEQHRSPGARAQAIATNGSTQPAIHGWRVAGSRNALTLILQVRTWGRVNVFAVCIGHHAASRRLSLHGVVFDIFVSGPETSAAVESS